MNRNEETCNFLDEEEPFQPETTKHNTTTTDTKLQKILKTLLIDISFVAVVGKIQVENSFIHVIY